MKTPRFKIGTMYKTRGASPRICTVIDILKTYNSKNELIQIRYVSTHEFLGQKVANYDVPETTIAMGYDAIIQTDECKGQ